MRAIQQWFAAGTALLLASCGFGGPAYEPASPGATVVEMTDLLDFSPATVTIRRNETIEWRNTSLLTHTVTADPDLANDPDHVELPPDAKRFHSGDVPPGQIYRRTFPVAGTYRYVCLPHESWGMMGTVVVEPRS